jgi:hypothetical protein
MNLRTDHYFRDLRNLAAPPAVALQVDYDDIISTSMARFALSPLLSQGD